MKDFIKKGGKSVADLGGNALKAAVAGILGEIVKEILEETGVTTIAKEKMMDVGLKVVKDMGVDPREIQRDLLKTAIRKELSL